MFDTLEEAAMRLNHTIIQGPNGPVYVFKCLTNNKIQYQELGKRGGLNPEMKEAFLSDAGFSVKPIRLGYINWEGRAVYLQRQPRRKYKQGLSAESLHYKCSKGKKISADELLLCGKPMLMLWQNSYPSIGECLSALNNLGVQAMAFSREWAIKDQGSLVLMYKGVDVGHSDEQGQLHLWQDRLYLMEALMEVLEA